MLATDFFKRIFSTANPTVSAIRGLGVMATDRIAPIKSRIIRQAMGM
jgi:2-polyprenyl-6-methoxyphenol hydroxylase-like FAD-dependent oxidoreductase